MPISTKTFLDKRPEAAMDTECYRDYWSIGFKNLATGKKIIIEKYAGLELDRAKIARVMRKFRIYSFNGNGYDMPMIALAMAGASNNALKEASDDIIVGQVRSWKFFDKYNVTLPDYLDHIDLFDVAPGVKLSLKKYGARMNMKRLQELPIDPSELVGAARRPLMRTYLGNDLDTTGELALNLREEIDIRNEISVEYGIDVRSKSDAQIAETLIAAEVRKLTGRKVEKPEVRTFSFAYAPPPFIKFKTPLLQNALKTVMSTRFFVSGEADKPGVKKKNFGVVRLPQAIKDLQIRIGSTDYKMGIGGLHSKEKKRSFIADEDTLIEDRDVRAYYPRIMLACGYVPEALGQNFLGVFTKFVNLRDAYKDKAAKLKKIGDTGQSMKYKKRSDSFKIVNNGSYGKTGSPFSVLYAPKLMISTTMTGQFSLLMLIEELELNKFTVISANTDGIVTVIPRDRYGEFASIVFDWEMDTSFSTEAVRYLGVYSRDVNSYVAVVEDMKKPGQLAMVKEKDGSMVPEVKRKGLFAKAGLQAKHDPTFDICSTAVVEYLTHGTDIEDTIMECDDITQFIGVKQVGRVTMADGSIVYGGYKDGDYLGKMVRWYYGEGENGFIAKANGARVAGTTGAVPCMDLPDELPDDIDYAWYVREAYARLDDLGLSTKNPKLQGRQGYVSAVLPKQKTAHVLDLQTQRSLCGRSAKNVREPWEEMRYLPGEMRMCKACLEERGYVDAEDDDDAL
jgi:hypothetical protein